MRPWLLGLPEAMVADRRLHRVREIHRRALQHDLAGDRAADVEQVVDQARHVHHLALDDAGGAQRHRLGLVRCSAERVHRALDGAERIAQLVRQHREELVLRAVLALRARQRADVAEDQRAVLDVVEHDARQRHLHFGGFLPVEHEARLVAARAVVEHRAQDLAFGGRQESARSTRRTPARAARARGPRSAGCSRRCRR